METSIDRLLTGADFTRKESPYDKEYEKQDYYWGLKHSALAEQVVSLAQNESQCEKHLLDVGSGEGRDAIYFAKCGFIVDALEISQPGIEKIKYYSQLFGCPVNTIHANMIGYEFVNDYDVIYFSWIFSLLVIYPSPGVIQSRASALFARRSVPLIEWRKEIQFTLNREKYIFTDIIKEWLSFMHRVALKNRTSGSV